MGHRRKAREYVLQALYMYEIAKNDIEELTTLHWIEKEIPEEIRRFAVDLITLTLKNMDTVDDLIRKYSKNWSFERLTLVDKAILRLSICALLYFPDIPVVVTINEGIELGKIYGGENSGQFINGILDSIKNAEVNRKEMNPGDTEEKK